MISQKIGQDLKSDVALPAEATFCLHYLLRELYFVWELYRCAKTNVLCEQNSSFFTWRINGCSVLMSDLVVATVPERMPSSVACVPTELLSTPKTSNWGISLQTGLHKHSLRPWRHTHKNPINHWNLIIHWSAWSDFSCFYKFSQLVEKVHSLSICPFLFFTVLEFWKRWGQAAGFHCTEI